MASMTKSRRVVTLSFCGLMAFGRSGLADDCTCLGKAGQNDNKERPALSAPVRLGLDLNLDLPRVIQERVMASVNERIQQKIQDKLQQRIDERMRRWDERHKTKPSSAVSPWEDSVSGRSTRMR